MVSGKRRSRSSTSPPGTRSARTLLRRSARVRASSSPVASSSVTMKRRPARSATWSRSSRTSSGQACGGHAPKSSARSAPAPTARHRAATAPPQRQPVREPVTPCTATKSRSEPFRSRPHDRFQKDTDMTSKKNRARAPKEINKKFKKKTSVLVTDKVDFIDYKDVNLLNRFVSDRSKIRNRRVTGNTVQQQRDIANAVKNAREMALLPYTKRVSQTRAGRPPRDRDEDGGGRRGGGDDGGRRDSFRPDAAAAPAADTGVAVDAAAVDTADEVTEA